MEEKIRFSKLISFCYSALFSTFSPHPTKKRSYLGFRLGVNAFRLQSDGCPEGQPKKHHIVSIKD